MMSLATVVVVKDNRVFKDLAMKKYIIFFALMLVSPVLQGWFRLMPDGVSSEVRLSLVPIARTTGGETQAPPNMTRHVGKHDEFYVQKIEGGTQPEEKWYKFDGTQAGAQQIQAIITGQLTWYYGDHDNGGEK